MPFHRHAPPRGPALAEILHGAGMRHPDYQSVKAPALNIAVVFDGPIPERREDDGGYKRFSEVRRSSGKSWAEEFSSARMAWRAARHGF